MKLTSAILPAAALVASGSVMASDIEHPVLNAFDKSQLSADSYFEDFQSEAAQQKWHVSHAKKDDEFTYVGKWEIEESFVNPAFRNDKGLVLKSPAAHHAISTKLPAVFNNKDNTLVLQYEVKLQKGLECGGAYIKLLSADGFPTNEEGDEFRNETPYEVMFGPDKCGATNKVHFIVKRPDWKTGEIEEKHLKVPPLARTGKTSNLYTLIIKPNNDFEIRINGEVAKAGNFDDDAVFKPAFNPPTEIDDPNDFKPEDWDDRRMIPDPEQPTKPEDWDESAPAQIPDPNAVKPEDWNEEASLYIEDPSAEKPEDWDDEEDGEWIAPVIPNPECEHHGCGPWNPPMRANPNFKGKWKQPTIPNPNYQGTWAPKKIPNPDYAEDINASDLNAIAGLGFELWTLQEDILFDNIYLGHSIEEAELIGNSTFTPKLKIEQLESAASAPKADFEPEKPPKAANYDPTSRIGQIIDFAMTKADQFVKDGMDFYYDVKESPVETLQARPFEALYYLAITLYTLVIATGISGAMVYALTGGSPSPVAQAAVVTSSTTTTKTTVADEDGDEVTIEEVVEEVNATGVSEKDE